MGKNSEANILLGIADNTRVTDRDGGAKDGARKHVNPKPVPFMER